MAKEQITFAGFNYPRYAVFLPRKPLKERLAKYKEGKRQEVSPYFQTKPCPNNDGRTFYLDSDFMPRLRWQWCDEVATSIGHRGWFTDEYGDSDKIRGIVMRLPNNRGFIPGWSMGDGMASECEYDVYDDEIECAYRADKLAERVAEDEREYRESQEQEDDD